MKDAGSVGARWSTIFRTKIAAGAASSPGAAKANNKTKTIDDKDEPQTPAKKRGRKPKAAQIRNENDDEVVARASKKARANSVADAEFEEGIFNESAAVVKEEYIG
jgi:hypothetical protein